jgi:hypothetical protein
VAGSTYYQLLIGRLLGYKMSNVLDYIASSGIPAPKEMQQQVDADIRALSGVPPKLPWRADDPPTAAAARSGKKQKGRAGAASKGGGVGFAAGKKGS